MALGVEIGCAATQGQRIVNDDDLLMMRSTGGMRPVSRHSSWCSKPRPRLGRGRCTASLDFHGEKFP
jgi:hypothetical protein